MNIGLALKAIANSSNIEQAFVSAATLADDAIKLKAAIADDLKQLQDGTLTAANVDTLTAAEKLLKDLGAVIQSVGALSGNEGLSAIGGALATA